MKKVAKIISAAFHPITLPTWMMAMLLFTGLARFQQVNPLVFLAMAFVNSFLLPFIIIVLMKQWKVIKSINMDDRGDLASTLIIMMLFLYATHRFFAGVPIFSIYCFYVTSVMVLYAIAFVVNLFCKVSLHALGCGGLVCCLFVLSTASAHVYLPYLICGILLSGAILSSRLLLAKNSQAQVYSGFGVGFTLTFIMYAIML